LGPKTTTSTPNIISDRCRQTEKRREIVFQPAVGSAIAVDHCFESIAVTLNNVSALPIDVRFGGNSRLS
jgi:hypothetical protein